MHYKDTGKQDKEYKLAVYKLAVLYVMMLQVCIIKK